MIRQGVGGLATRSCAPLEKGERDRTQNRRPLLLIALAHAPLLENIGLPVVLLNEPEAGSFVHDMF
jgi:hypothetical protein